MKEIIDGVIKSRIFQTIITIIISALLYKIFSNFVLKGRTNKKIKNKLDNRQRTYLRLFNNFIKYAFMIVTLLIILQINGVNVNSMLAGFGILGAVIGLALQDALKDIIMGANLVTDNYFAVGDVVKYNNIEGKVIEFGLKVTKIQEIMTGNILSISNRNITEIQKVSNNLYIDIPSPYEISVEQMENIIAEIVEKSKEQDKVEDCNYLGLSDFKDSCMIYKLEVKCKPEDKYAVRRSIQKIIKLTFDSKHIEIPYQQICIHTDTKEN